MGNGQPGKGNSITGPDSVGKSIYLRSARITRSADYAVSMGRLGSVQPRGKFDSCQKGCKQRPFSLTQGSPSGIYLHVRYPRTNGKITPVDPVSEARDTALYPSSPPLMLWFEERGSNGRGPISGRVERSGQLHRPDVAPSLHFDRGSLTTLNPTICSTSLAQS